MSKILPFFKNTAALILLIMLGGCQEKDDIVQEDNHQASQIHKDKIEEYWNHLKIGAGTVQSSQIDALSEAADISSLKIYDLRTTEKLLVADAKSLDGMHGTIKIIFYLNDNKIVRSNIVTFNDRSTSSNYNKVILSVLNADKKDFNYSGEITFWSLSKIKMLYSKYDQGNITENITLSASRNSSSTNKAQGSCTEYWWVTRSGGEIINQVLLFIICDCSGGGGGGGVGEETSKMNNCNEGSNIFLGGSGASSTTTYKPTLPSSPIDKQTYKFTDPDGVCTEYIFDAATNSWQILQVMLPNIIIANNKDNYGILDFQWPVNNQKVFDPLTNLLYTYEQGSDSWIGVPGTDLLVAKAIEDQIDDSQLDACTKAVLNKMKNLQQNDIAAMLARFSPRGSIFNIHMSTGYLNGADLFAQTTKVQYSSTDINMVFNQDYITGKDNPSRPTDLSVATTMAHEIIHAYLISLLQNYLSCGDSGICDFPTVYEAYVQNEIARNPQILPDAHHELIAEKYVNSIASIVQEFHTGQPAASGLPSQVYLDMAWGGLTQTALFTKKYPNDPNHKNYKERERIFARINTEKLGSEYGVNMPVGTPCK